MPIALAPAGGNIFRVELRGTLRKADLDRCQAQLAAAMRRDGPVRLLFVLERFDGWDSGDDWHDLSFYATYGDRIERIAIVGDEKWRSEALMFAGADLRRAPVEFFAGPPASTDAARVWLTS